jgi:hypothetical protein
MNFVLKKGLLTYVLPMGTPYRRRPLQRQEAFAPNLCNPSSLTRVGSLIWRAQGKLDMWARTHIACMGCNSIAYVYMAKVHVSVFLVGL